MTRGDHNLVTIHDVARAAGVSAATVSNVLNDNGKTAPKTKQKVLQVMEELHYVPNYVLRGQKSHPQRLIGILCETINTKLSTRIISGFTRRLKQLDYESIIFPLNLEERILYTDHFDYAEIDQSEEFQRALEHAISSLQTAGVSGILYIGAHLRKIKTPPNPNALPIIYSYCCTDDSVTSINYDDFQGAKLAVEHLIQAGHTRIALLCGQISSTPSHKRLMAYQTALMEHGLRLYPEYVVSGNWNFEDGQHAFNQLMSLSEPPTAIFCMSDFMAAGVMARAAECGVRVPEDLSVVGFDDLDFSELLHPPLTTVTVPLFDLGIFAANQMVECLKYPEKKPESYPLLHCKLTIRKSVAPPKKNE